MPYTSDYEKTLYNPKWLRRAYKKAGYNAAIVAERIGCTTGAVLDNLRKHGISIKPRENVRQTGSHAARPRARFITTLHNADWLRKHYVEKRMTATEVAHLAGASIPSTLRALRVAGIEIRSSGEARRFKPNPKRRVANPSVVAMRVRARKKMPPGPCVICGAPGVDVNHRDRDPMNEAIENLERLCVGCHRQQHVEEERVMIEMLRKRGVSYISIHVAARERLLKKK